MRTSAFIIPVTLIALLVLLLISAALAAPPVCGPAGCSLAAAPAKPQTLCPVMGGKINKKNYADVKGYRIYVCCPGCTAAIKADPDKYIKKIQATGEAPEPLSAPAPAVCKACGAPKGSAACKAGCAKTAANVAPKPAEPDATISTKGLAALLRARLPIVVLDARTGKFDDGRRVPGAKSLSAAATVKQAAALIKNKDTVVVTYCSNLKCPASSYLAKRLHTLGYKNVVEYPNGIEGWAAAGNKVVKVSK